MFTGNVATAVLAIATTYFLHLRDEKSNFFFDDAFFSGWKPCGENGKFCRLIQSHRDEVGTTMRAFAGNNNNNNNNEALCANTRRRVERAVFGQEESTEMLLDAICDKFREIDFSERYGGGDDENSVLLKPLVMSIHGSPGVGKSHFHRVLARAAYGVNENNKEKEEQNRGQGAKIIKRAFRNFVQKVSSDGKKKTCPGALCPAYKILFGAEYVEKDRARQKRMIVSNLRAHLRRFPESIVVIEEYDKLPCEVRSVLRQLFDSGRVMQSTPSSRRRRRRTKKRGGLSRFFWRRGDDEEEVGVAAKNGEEDDEYDDDGNDTFEDYDVNGEKREVLGNKAIFILEANAGFVHIHGAAEADRKRRLGDASKKSDSERERGGNHVELSRALKNAMFTKWEKEHCEDFHDTVKVLSSIEYFVPFQPLDEDALKQIANAHLEYRSKYFIENEFISSMLTTLASKPSSNAVALPSVDAIKRRINVTLRWDDSLLAFLARESEFEGEFAIEGGKEVKSTLSRTVTRAIRRALLPSSTTFTDERGETNHSSSLAQYEKICDFILKREQDAKKKKKFASATTAAEEEEEEEDEDENRDRVAKLQINVRLALLSGSEEEEEEEQKSSATTKRGKGGETGSQRRRSVVVASIEVR
jgi:hypothetical protein